MMILRTILLIGHFYFTCWAMYTMHKIKFEWWVFPTVGVVCTALAVHAYYYLSSFSKD